MVKSLYNRCCLHHKFNDNAKKRKLEVCLNFIVLPVLTASQNYRCILDKSVSVGKRTTVGNLTPSLPQPVKFPGLKSVHIHATPQNSIIIGWSYSKSTFNAVHFDKKIP